MAFKTIDERVAANVRAEMGRRSISQTALAETLGCTQQAVSRRLTGRASFSVADLERIADALDVPINTLMSHGASV